MKIKWSSLCLALVLIAVWLFLFIFVFPRGSRGSETFLQPGTAAVVYFEGNHHYFQSPNPEKVEQALKESQPHRWVDAGKKIAAVNAVIASYFYIGSLKIPGIHPYFWAAKGGAAALSGIFTGIAAGVGVSVIWVDSRRPKLSWKEAKFCFLYPEEEAWVLKFPDGNVGVMIIEGKLEKYFIAEGKKFLVISREETDLPHHTLLDAQILSLREKSILPSRKLEVAYPPKLKGEGMVEVNREILVLY